METSGEVFHRLEALPVIQPTVLKHQKEHKALMSPTENQTSLSLDSPTNSREKELALFMLGCLMPTPINPTHERF